MLVPAPPDPFLLSCSPATHLPVCTCVWHYSVPGTEPGIFLWWTSCCCWLPNVPIYPDPSVRLLVPPGSQSASHFSVISKPAEDMVHSCIQIEKILNRTSPRTELWGSPLVTASQMQPHSLLLFELSCSASASPRIVWTCLFHSWTIFPEGCCEAQYQRPYQNTERLHPLPSLHEQLFLLQSTQCMI